MPITLVCRSGSLSGQSFTFTQALITLGREPSNLVRFDSALEPRVSAHHCELYLQDGAYYARDKGSMNGTLINGVPVTAPAVLRDGAILKLGDKGPEFAVSIVGLPVDRTLANTMPNPQRAAALAPTLRPGTTPAPSPAPAPTAKQGIGLMTLERELGQAKAEVRAEYQRKSGWTVLLVGVVLLVALGLSGVVYWLSTRQISSVQSQLDTYASDLQAVVKKTNSLAQRTAVSDQEWRDSVKFITENIRQSQESLAELQKKFDTDSTAASATREEWKRRLEAQTKAVDAMRRDLLEFQTKNEKCLQEASAPFAGCGERWNDTAFAVVLEYQEEGKTKLQFVASAFAINPDPGLLGTNAHVTKFVEPFLNKPGYEVQVRSSAGPRYTYRVSKVISHPGFALSGSSPFSPDVGILEVNLQTKRGEFLPLPGYLRPATEEDLDAIRSGMILAIFGYPGNDGKNMEVIETATKAILVTGIVSSTQTFSLLPVTGRSFDFLQHTCASLPGNSGSPMILKDGKVVALENCGKSLQVGQMVVSASPVSFAVNVRFLKELLKTYYPQVMWQ